MRILIHTFEFLDFEKPMKSFKTGTTISLSDYIKEMNEAVQSEWASKLPDIKRKKLSKGIPVRTELLVAGG